MKRLFLAFALLCALAACRQPNVSAPVVVQNQPAATPEAVGQYTEPQLKFTTELTRPAKASTSPVTLTVKPTPSSQAKTPTQAIKPPVKVLKLPGDSPRLLPVLRREIESFWPELSHREFLAGAVDQESNWKLKAALKTHREFGCGLGQFTVAYDANGKVRFDALKETKRLDKSLSDWNWEDCYNEIYQLRAVTLKFKLHANQCDDMMDGPVNALSCAGGMYNGGEGGTLKRIRLCKATPGCDPTVWEDNLALQCPQSKQRVEGYGESFCEINSKYPGRVWSRSKKFTGLLGGD